MIFFFFSSSCTFFHTRERNGFSLSPSPVVGLTIPLTRLKFNYTCNPQRHRVKHREKTSIVFELRRERRDSRVTRMCVAARERIITVTTYPLLHRIMKPSYRYFRAATVFCTFGAASGAAKTSRKQAASGCLNGIPPRASQPPAFVRSDRSAASSSFLLDRL